jgi:hypothetical protein
VINEDAKAEETVPSEEDIEIQQQEVHLEPEVIPPSVEEDEQVVFEAAVKKESAGSSVVAEPEETKSAPAASPSADPVEIKSQDAERPTDEL